MSYELSLFGSPDATDHEQEAALTRLRAIASPFGHGGNVI